MHTAHVRYLVDTDLDTGVTTDNFYWCKHRVIIPFLFFLWNPVRD